MYFGLVGVVDLCGCFGLSWGCVVCLWLAVVIYTLVVVCMGFCCVVFMCSFGWGCVGWCVGVLMGWWGGVLVGCCVGGV